MPLATRAAALRLHPEAAGSLVKRMSQTTTKDALPSRRPLDGGATPHSTEREFPINRGDGLTADANLPGNGRNEDFPRSTDALPLGERG